MEMLTSAEKKKIEERLESLKAKRPEITTRIAEARALGDLKENADYHAAREEQGLNEAEIRRLEDRLANSGVVGDQNLPDDIVFIGSTVRMRDLDSGDEELFRLVGEPSGEFDEDVSEVSASSEMGENLMKARVGDVVKVQGRRSVIRFEIVEIL